MTALRMFFAVGFAINGLWMLVAPFNWFTTIPGVVDSGPFNDHFVRDVGIAYALSGVAFAQLARGVAGAQPYAMAGVIFLLAHAGFHLVETLAGVRDIPHLLTDLPGVVLLPLVAAWAARR
jgi:hypothetical protein